MAETSDTLVTQRCRFLTAKEMFYDIGQDASAPSPARGCSGVRRHKTAWGLTAAAFMPRTAGRTEAATRNCKEGCGPQAAGLL